MIYDLPTFQQKLEQYENRIKILEREKFELSRIGFEGLQRKDHQITQLNQKLLEQKQQTIQEQQRADDFEQQNLVLQQRFLRSQQLVRKLTKPPAGYPPPIKEDEVLENDNLNLKKIIFENQKKIKMYRII